MLKSKADRLKVGDYIWVWPEDIDASPADPIPSKIIYASKGEMEGFKMAFFKVENRMGVKLIYHLNIANYHLCGSKEEAKLAYEKEKGMNHE